ncbi:reverse transcriptase domain-containing protein [Paraburkholderia sp. MM5482-R1]|uniref:reverse transcriptase domain-containing protein n=1 Tax=unclassified Paraburkholderia TaxID=2615204 RepID=UPI003D2104F4
MNTSINQVVVAGLRSERSSGSQSEERGHQTSQRPEANWQLPSILPRLVNGRELNRLVYGYRFDPLFIQWRRQIARRHGELIEEIRRLSLRLIHERPGRALKEKVDRFLRSPLVQCDILHDTWLDQGGPFRHLTLAERQATFYTLWKDRIDDFELLPSPLNPSIACSEPFYRRGKPKHDGRWRNFYSFGIARTTRQRLVHVALAAATCNQYRAQSMYNGGMSAVADEVTRIFTDHPELTHWAKLDIQNCFDNIRLTSAHEFLPLAPKVIQQTVAINVKEAIDQRESDHRRYEHYLRRCTGLFASGPSLALPQGAASSALVAYSLIESGLPPFSPDRVMLYGDDLLVLGESQEEVRAQVCRFRSLFERHPAGPLQITLEGEGKLQEGFEFLGMEFKRIMQSRTTGAPLSLFTSVRLPASLRTRFIDNVRSRVEQAIEYGDPELSEASRYVRGFWGSKPTHDRVELLLQACLLIEQLGADSGPIWNIMAG